jgi:ribosome-binding factor A
VSQRKARVEHALREALQSAIANDVKDPRVRAATMVTVSKVEMNVDLTVANVYVSIVGGKPHVRGARSSAQVDDAMADGVIAGLAKAAGFLRGPIGRELGMQHAPELRFFHDSSVDISEKLAAIVRDDEERAKAVGRKAGEAQPPDEEEPT